eukprot:6180860-Pleurochrysis_carterae.AAC.3
MVSSDMARVYHRVSYEWATSQTSMPFVAARFAITSSIVKYETGPPSAPSRNGTRNALKPFRDAKPTRSSIEASCRPAGKAVELSAPHQVIPLTINGRPLARSSPSTDSNARLAPYMLCSPPLPLIVHAPDSHVRAPRLRPPDGCWQATKAKKSNYFGKHNQTFAPGNILLPAICLAGWAGVQLRSSAVTVSEAVARRGAESQLSVPWRCALALHKADAPHPTLHHLARSQPNRCHIAVATLSNTAAVVIFLELNLEGPCLTQRDWHTLGQDRPALGHSMPTKAVRAFV